MLRLLTPRLARTTRSYVDVAAYRRDGYTIPEWSLPAERLRSARDALDSLLADNQGVMPEQLVNAHLVKGGGAVRGQDEFLALASMPEIADMAAKCLGTENVILWACQVWSKPAGTGKSVPWHQDGQYWPIEPLRAMTAWIALDRSDDESGALRIVPGTHASGETIPHVQKVEAGAAISYVADPSLLDAPLLATAATLTLEPGQVSLHDSMVLHASGPNASPRRRAGVAATFMPGESHFYRDRPTEGALKGGLDLDYSSRPLFVVRGRNAHPDNELVHDLTS